MLEPFSLEAQKVLFERKFNERKPKFPGPKEKVGNKYVIKDTCRASKIILHCKELAKVL